MRKSSPRIDPSLKEAVMDKATEVNCERLGRLVQFEEELNAWIDEDEKIKEVEEDG